MSNQTFVKKDRISFAQNLNEMIVIAPSNITTNALYIGPNSAITYDGDSNVDSINYLQGVTLSNQYIYADGTYLSNLPTAVTTSNLVSTVVGLGTVGYISSTQLQSTVQGINSYISSFIDPTELSSTIIGIVTPDFISSVGFTSSITSSIVGLGTFGYISSLSLQSTVTGLGNIYISTNSVPSTIVGLGTFGYISSTQLTSTVTGLGNIYLSTNIVPSTIVGLGTFGYVSSFNSISTNNISAGNLFANIVNTSTISNTDGIFTNSVSTGNLFANVINGSTINILHGISTTSLNTLLINSSTINNLTNICTTRLFTRVFNASDGNYISLGGLGLNTGNGANLGQIGFQFNNIIGSNVFTSNISAGTISTRNLGVSTLFFSTAQGYQISTNRIVGETRTNNLYPLTTGAIIGYGSLTGDLGFYNEGHFRSTFTQVIQGSLDNNMFSNIVRIQGTVSTLNQQVSSLTANILTTSNIETRRISKPAGMGEQVPTTDLEPTTGNVTQLGYGFAGNFNGFFSKVYTVSTVTSNIVHPLGGGITSSIRVLGTLSTQNQVTSSITTNILFGLSIDVSSITANGSNLFNLNAISSLSLNSTIEGLGTFGYLSTNTIPSTIIGLGTFGYLSTNTVPSTIVGLGTFGYLSTNTVPSTIVGLGTFGYISTSQLESTIVGWAGIPASVDLDMDGKFITNVNQLIVDAINTYTQPSVGFVTDINLASNSIHDVNTITTEYISSSLGTVILSNSHFIPSADDSYDLGSATNRWRELYVAGTSIHLGNTLVLSEDSSGRLSTNQIIFTPGLDLDNKAITSVLQTQTVNSAATNATIPQTLFYSIGNVEFADDYVQIQPDPPLSPQYLFKNLGNFQYFKVSCSLSGSGVETPINFYFELAKSVGEVTVKFGGELVNDSSPYYSIPNPIFGGGLHNISYVDRYDLTGLATNNIIYPLLWVRTETTTAQFNPGLGKILLTIEPIQEYPYV